MRKNVGKDSGKKPNDSLASSQKRPSINNADATKKIKRMKQEITFTGVKNERDSKKKEIGESDESPHPHEALPSTNTRKRTRKASPNHSGKVEAEFLPANMAPKANKSQSWEGRTAKQKITIDTFKLYPIGQRICKDFPGHGMFHGHVQKCPTSKNPFYDVVYTDGDIESIDIADLPKYVLFPIGQKIKKNFPNHGTYVGKVKEHPSSKHPFYEIIYSDGDAEHIHIDELHKYVTKSELSKTATPSNLIGNGSKRNVLVKENNIRKATSDLKIEKKQDPNPQMDALMKRAIDVKVSKKKEEINNDDQKRKHSEEAANQEDANKSPASNKSKISLTNKAIDAEGSKNIESLLEQVNEEIKNNETTVEKATLTTQMKCLMFVMFLSIVLLVLLLFANHLGFPDFAIDGKKFRLLEDLDEVFSDSESHEREQNSEIQFFEERDKVAPPINYHSQDNSTY